MVAHVGAAAVPAHETARPGPGLVDFVELSELTPAPRVSTESVRLVVSRGAAAGTEFAISAGKTSATNPIAVSIVITRSSTIRRLIGSARISEPSGGSGCPARQSITAAAVSPAYTA